MSLRLDNGESGQLVTPLTTQNLLFQGGSGITEATSFPTYSGYLPAGKSTLPKADGDTVGTAVSLANTDNLASAIAKMGYLFPNRFGDTFKGAMVFGAATTGFSAASLVFQTGTTCTFADNTLKLVGAGAGIATLSNGNNAANCTFQMPVKAAGTYTLATTLDAAINVNVTSATLSVLETTYYPTLVSSTGAQPLHTLDTLPNPFRVVQKDLLGFKYSEVYSTYFNGDLNGNCYGNANTVTAGVYTTGSYANPAWITSLAGSKITGSVTNATNATRALSLVSGNIVSYVDWDDGAVSIREYIGHCDSTNYTPETAFSISMSGKYNLSVMVEVLSARMDAIETADATCEIITASYYISGGVATEVDYADNGVYVDSYAQLQVSGSAVRLVVCNHNTGTTRFFYKIKYLLV